VQAKLHRACVFLVFTKSINLQRTSNEQYFSEVQLSQRPPKATVRNKTTMADPSTCPPLTPQSVREAHSKIKAYIHRTPLLTSHSLDAIASSPDPAAYLAGQPPPFPSQQHNHATNGAATNGNNEQADDGVPKYRLWFKCENFQKIGAFKARGAFHAVTRLIETLGIEEVRRRGVVTHSSGKLPPPSSLYPYPHHHEHGGSRLPKTNIPQGNHAQALALAAHTFSIPSYIVMPSISTPSKIAGTRIYTPDVIFSGSTSVEREAVVADVIKDKNAILVPPYDHPDIMLGQGTVGFEMDEQFREQRKQSAMKGEEGRGFDAVITPLGGGGLLGGVATYFSESPHTVVFGSEPSFQGGDDGRRGLAEGKRIEHVKTLTIADGLRTPVGMRNWDVISDKRNVEGVYAVSESEIRNAMRFVYERLKVVVEPSCVVPLAVVLFDKGFREMVVRRQQESGRGVWDVGIVLTGGNTTMKAIAKLFVEEESERETGQVGRDGQRRAEDVAG
jgi:threonine dehydratase